MSESAQAWVGDLAEQFGGMVFAVAFRIVGNADDAEDAMQEVFTKLLRLGGPAGGARDWPAYLKTMATTAGLDLLRRRSSRPAMSIEWIEDLPAADGCGPRENADRRQRAAILRTAIGSLPDREGVIFGLRYFEELSYEAIAEQTGVQAGNVGVILHRARKRLLEVLKPLLSCGGPDTQPRKVKEQDDERAPTGRSRA
jgi:RNA polymerase sigma-70 factor (ECF subfamily)